MKRFFYLVFVLISFVRCKETNNNLKMLNELPRTHKDFIKITNPEDTLGTLISTITFKTRNNGHEIKGLDNSWVSIKDPMEDLKYLRYANDIVIPFNTINLIVDYPLTTSATFELSGREKGFSRKALVEEVSKKYHFIYEEEKKITHPGANVNRKESMSHDRAETGGKFGIWRDESMDLYLGTIEVYKNSTGKVYIILEVSS